MSLSKATKVALCALPNDARIDLVRELMGASNAPITSRYPEAYIRREELDRVIHLLEQGQP